MVRIRLTEDCLADGVLSGKIICPCHLYVGQEAIAAGICASLKTTDYVFGTHRSHGHYIAKGGSIKSLIAEVYGKETGSSRGRGGSMHLVDTRHGFMGAQPLVAGTIPLAVGSALASKIKKEKRVTVVFFGDGATEEGVFHESVNFAAIKKLPVIFVCENNFYSSHLHIRERRANNIYEHGPLAGITGLRIDGNDALHIYETAKAAVAKARVGNGPTLIEAVTYRLRGHVGAHDNVKDQDVRDIRDPEEIAGWLKKEPIGRFKKYLIKNKIADEKITEQIKKKAAKEVEAALRFAEKSPYPNPKTLTNYVFK